MLDFFKDKDIPREERVSMRQAKNESLSFARDHIDKLSNAFKEVEELEKLLTGPIVEFDKEIHTKVCMADNRLLHDSKRLFIIYSSDMPICAWFE